MDWASYLLLLNLKVSTFCNSLLLEQPDCNQIVQECVLDGEELEWCTEDYLKHNYTEKRIKEVVSD